MTDAYPKLRDNTIQVVIGDKFAPAIPLSVYDAEILRIRLTDAIATMTHRQSARDAVSTAQDHTTYADENGNNPFGNQYDSRDYRPDLYS